MDDWVKYENVDGLATLMMDDGKVNVMSVTMLNSLNRALDRAVAENAVVLLTGRPGVFSAGFHLPTLRAGGPAAHEMVKLGFETAERLLSLPSPVVIACTGHAIAMGVFIVLAGDYRVGADGDYRLGATEVALGITMPFFGIEMCRQRLAPAHFSRAVLTAERYAPAPAVTAGFLDDLAPPSQLGEVARRVAMEFSKFDREAFAATKARARGSVLTAVRAAIEADMERRRTHERASR
jgi:enoyl-CoA hydratase